MIGLMTLAVLGFAGLIVLAGVFTLLALVKAVLWLVLLPFRLLFGLVFGIFLIPLLILKLVLFVIGAILLVLLAPVLLIGVVGAVIGAVVGLAGPLLPLACIGFVVWVVMRSRREPVHLERRGVVS
jgi:hypothetical protein